MASIPDQPTYLSILARADAPQVKAFADALIPLLPPVAVLQNRTGLVMTPMEDSGQGALFYVGEVLIAEAHVRVGESEGYAACLGRDLEQALAIALIDAAVVAGIERERIGAFVAKQAAALEDADRRLLEQVEATRVEMETF